MFPIVCSRLQPQRPYLLQWISLQISISRLFLVAPSTYILAEIHTILTDMLLHGIHLSSATLHVINLQLYGYRKLYLNLHLKLYLKLFRKLHLKLFRKLHLKLFRKLHRKLYLKLFRKHSPTYSRPTSTSSYTMEAAT